MLADRPGWITGGGATIIGGGGAYGNLSSAPAAVKKMGLTWYVGADDGYGATRPSNWSALNASQDGLSAYQRAGFTNSKRTVLPKTNHTQYDVADLIGDDLDRLYPAAPAGTATPAPKPTTPPTKPSTGTTTVNGHALKGGIAASWKARGGESWAKPVSGEHGSGHGSVYQRFVAKNGTELALYWSPTTGTHLVDYGGAIGQRFAAGGYAGTYGPPSSEKTAAARGGFKQTFAAGNRTHTISWSAASGAHVTKNYGAIGQKWAALGREGGKLGYPTTNEYKVRGGVQQYFTNGVVKWNSTNGSVSVRTW